MLRITLQLVPGGVGEPTVIGRGVIGLFNFRHLSEIWDDRQGYRVGAVENHDPDEGVWSLVADALLSCLKGDAYLDPEALSVIARAYRSGEAHTTGDELVQFVWDHGSDSDRQALYDLAVNLTSGSEQGSDELTSGTLGDTASDQEVAERTEGGHAE